MQNKFLLIFLLFILTTFTLDAKKYVSGYVRDAQTGEKLIGAYIIEHGTNIGSSTDINGYFNLVFSGNTLKVSYVGYQPQLIQIDKDTLITIYLASDNEIETITIEGRRVKGFNIATLDARQINSIPAIGGKPDVIKTLQLLPGIQTQKEGSSLMNVRGGNPGENLYLIDNVPLIYMNHLGGFTSVFNPDMINSVQVYKGGFPAKYGGKLSSVVAISQREGNRDKVKGSFGVGVTDASFTVEGPINDKWSFIVNGRKTLTDALYIAVSSIADQDFIIRYGFHDVNAKLTWRPDLKNSFSFNLYQGDDYLNFRNKRKLHEKDGRNEYSNIWGNWLASARWTKTISPKLVSDNTLSISRYRLKLSQDYRHEKDSVKFYRENISSVRDFRYSTDWNYRINSIASINFGAQNSFLTYIPNKYYRSNFPQARANEKINTNEGALYMNNELNFAKLIEANIGARMVAYWNNDFFDYSFEPRISVIAHITKKLAVNLSYQRVKQYAHLLFASGSLFNNEIWVPASEQFNPSQSNQYSFGIKGSLLQEMFQHEINFYYKDMTKLSNYREGYMNFLGDGGWRSKIESGGKGISYGTEFLLKKVKGQWTGFAGYTYSKTTRQFPGINGGKEYLFDYHRPHSVTISLNRKLNDKWDFGLNWVYQTGLPYTPVLGRQTYIDGSYIGEALVYGERNSATIRDYHRLDLGFTLNTCTKRDRRAQWNFSVYNAYNRNNAYNYLYLYSKSVSEGHFKREGESLKLYQQGMFPIIPTVAYKVFFDSDERKQIKNQNANLNARSKINVFDISEKNRWEIMIGRTISPSLNNKYSGTFSREIFPKYLVDISYGFTNILKAGSYLGVQQYSLLIPNESDSELGHMSIYRRSSLLAGVQSKFVYSQFINPIKHFVNLYISGSVGLQRYSPNKDYSPHGTQFRYGTSAGASFILSEHVGAFVEYGFGRYGLNNTGSYETEFRYGICVRF